MCLSLMALSTALREKLPTLIMRLYVKNDLISTLTIKNDMKLIGRSYMISDIFCCIRC
jgi:hypothetical protein